MREAAAKRAAAAASAASGGGAGASSPAESIVTHWILEPLPGDAKSALAVRGALLGEEVAFYLETWRLAGTRDVVMQAADGVQVTRAQAQGGGPVPANATIGRLMDWAHELRSPSRERDPAVLAALGAEATEEEDDDVPPPAPRLPGHAASGGAASHAEPRPASAYAGAIESRSRLPPPGSSARPGLMAQVSAVARLGGGGGGIAAAEALFIGDDCVACAVCGKSAASVGLATLLMCGRCRRVAYCSAACQRADWKAGHKAACGGGLPVAAGAS